MRVRLFHSSKSLEESEYTFRDAPIRVGNLELMGVWLEDRRGPTVPLDVILDIDMERLAWYRIAFRTTNHRGWCIPAAVVNLCSMDVSPDAAELEAASDDGPR